MGKGRRLLGRQLPRNVAATIQKEFQVQKYTLQNRKLYIWHCFLEFLIIYSIRYNVMDETLAGTNVGEGLEIPLWP